MLAGSSNWIWRCRPLTRLIKESVARSVTSFHRMAPLYVHAQHTKSALFKVEPASAERAGQKAPASCQLGVPQIIRTLIRQDDDSLEARHRGAGKELLVRRASGTAGRNLELAHDVHEALVAELFGDDERSRTDQVERVPQLVDSVSRIDVDLIISA